MRIMNLIGVLGFDVDEVNEMCRDLGAVYYSSELGRELLYSMWKELIEKVPFHIEKFYGFYHVENNNCARFNEDIYKLKEQDRHSIFVLKITIVEQRTIYVM